MTLWACKERPLEIGQHKKVRRSRQQRTAAGVTGRWELVQAHQGVRRIARAHLSGKSWQTRFISSAQPYPSVAHPSQDCRKIISEVSAQGLVHVGSEALLDLPGSGLNRVPRQVDVASGRLDLTAAEELPDHRRALVESESPGREGTTQITCLQQRSEESAYRRQGCPRSCARRP